MFYNQAKKSAIRRLDMVEQWYNSMVHKAKDLTLELYELRKSASVAIDRVETYINALANSPKEFAKEIADVRLSVSEFNEATRIESQSISDNTMAGRTAATGIAAGSVVAVVGPKAAMAIATTFGEASTGTAIAALSGAPATNAALAWLGGGTLATGGGGVAAGESILAALGGPVAWGIAGAFVVGGGVYAVLKNIQTASKAEKTAADIERQIKILGPKNVKLKSLIEETEKLKPALDITLMVNTYPKDYRAFSQNQKQVLAALINNARAMGKLINERIS